MWTTGELWKNENENKASILFYLFCFITKLLIQSHPHLLLRSSCMQLFTDYGQVALTRTEAKMASYRGKQSATACGEVTRADLSQHPALSNAVTRNNNWATRFHLQDCRCLLPIASIAFHWLLHLTPVQICRGYITLYSDSKCCGISVSVTSQNFVLLCAFCAGFCTP